MLIVWDFMFEVVEFSSLRTIAQWKVSSTTSSTSCFSVGELSFVTSDGPGADSEVLFWNASTGPVPARVVPGANGALSIAATSGVVFVCQPRSPPLSIIAIEAESGDVIWKYPLPPTVTKCALFTWPL